MSNIIALFSHGLRRRGRDRFEELVAPHVEHLYRLAYRFTGARNDAEDLVQDLLVKLYPRCGELERVEALRPWLARALYHQFIDGVRRYHADPLRNSEDPEVLEEFAAPRANTEQEIATEQLRDRLVTALETLNPDQRALITLHDVEGYTLTELEGILDTPLGTLKSRLHRARARMRDQLGKDDDPMEPSKGYSRVKGRGQS